MNVLIYGSARESELFIQHMRSQACMAFRTIDYSHTDDYETFLMLLKNKYYDIVFVAMDNAAGMEGVIATQNVYPDIPIIWFTNDKNFVAQSYRLGVTCFAVKPIDEKVMKLALGKCQI